jgi:hypothetical protein
MAETKVAEIKADRTDDAGNDIICLYAKSPPDYAVYRNPQRVSVQFADDKKKARQQRLAIAALNPLRGQISGLIDGWHSSANPHQQSRANRYDRRVADAMIMGLEGSVVDALALLTEIRDDIVAERRSLAQTDYLVWAAGIGLILIALLALISSAWFQGVYRFPDFAGSAMTGAAGGTIGAFFSIATGLRSRTVLVDLQQWDNRRDAILRVAVGTIGGGVLICMLLTKLIAFAGIGADSLNGANGTDAVLTALVLGFLAGFSERAVPDLLAKASLATDAKTGDTTDVAGDQARAAAAAIQNPHSGDSDEDDSEEAPSAESDVDHCLCDAPPQPVETLTRDEDLPPSSGGVSDSVPPPAADAAAPAQDADSGGGGDSEGAADAAADPPEDVEDAGESAEVKPDGADNAGVGATEEGESQ